MSLGKKKVSVKVCNINQMDSLFCLVMYDPQGMLPVDGENVKRRWHIAKAVCFKDRHWERVSVKELLVLSCGAFEGLPGVNTLQGH